MIPSSPSPEDVPESVQSRPPIPITWPGLLSANREPVSLGLQMIRDVPVELETVTSPWLPSGSFGGSAHTLAAAVVVAGPAACAEAMHRLLPFVPRVMDDFAEGINAANCVHALSLLSFFNTVQCSGAELSPLRGMVPRVAFAAEGSWPARIAQHLPQLGQRERQTLAFAALAVDEIELVPTLLGGEPLPEEIPPAQLFDCDTSGFLRYLATAVRDFAPREEVEPAWLAFLDCFPHKLEVGTLEWTDLLYSARIFLTRFRGDALSTVASTMHTIASA